MEDSEIFKGSGAFESPEDYRDVFVEEVVGATETPEEFFSPYLVAAYLKNGTNDQKGRNSCVMESADKTSESLCSWIVTPDSIPNGEVIGYLFDLVDGKIKLKEKISKEIKDFSAEFGYYIAKQIDGIPNSSGTYISSAGKVLTDKGISEESMHPSVSQSDSEVLKRKPSDEAYSNAERYKIVRYSSTRNSLESYKLGIWSGNANVVVGGYPLGGDMNQPQKPPTKPNFGHANAFFGYSKDSVFSLGSWTKNYGLKLPLKIFNHPKFGSIFIRGTMSDNVVVIEGCHQINSEWFPNYIFKGLTFFDEKFSPELEDRIMQPKLLLEEITNRVYVILNNKRYWVSPYASYQDLQKSKIAPEIGADKLPMVNKMEIRQYPWGGFIGSVSLSDYIKFLSGQL